MAIYKSSWSLKLSLREVGLVFVLATAVLLRAGESLCPVLVFGLVCDIVGIGLAFVPDIHAYIHTYIHTYIHMYTCLGASL